MGRFIAILLITVFTEICNSAPARYDQRQEGKLNVHANLENFVVLVATSGSQNGGLLSDIAAQALELKNLASRAAVSKTSEETAEYGIDEGPSSIFKENKEPYRVEIVRIRKDENHRSTDTEEKRKTKDPLDHEENTKPLKDVDISVNGGIGQRGNEEFVGSSTQSEIDAKQALKIAEDAKKIEDESSAGSELSIPVVAIISGESSTRKARDVGEKRTAGISVKKELSREDSAIPREKNETESPRDKPEEYKLLTDGVHGLENCGPDGYRDRKNFMCKIKKHLNAAK